MAGSCAVFVWLYFCVFASLYFIYLFVLMAFIQALSGSSSVFANLYFCVCVFVLICVFVLMAFGQAVDGSCTSSSRSRRAAAVKAAQLLWCSTRKSLLGCEGRTQLILTGGWLPTNIGLVGLS